MNEQDTRQEHSKEFLAAIAPLSVQEFQRLPPDDRKPAWDRYLAAIKTEDLADAVVLRSTGPRRNCWKVDCANVCAQGEWYCADHCPDKPQESVEGVSVGAMMYGSDEEYQEDPWDLPLWAFVPLVLAIVFVLLVLWGIVHGLGLPAILGGGPKI